MPASLDWPPPAARGYAGGVKASGPCSVGIIGPACWCLTPLSFVVQVAAATSWSPRYDLTVNTISDLGLAGSPRHALMNASLVALGLLVAAGALAARGRWPPGRVTDAGL